MFKKKKDPFSQFRKEIELQAGKNKVMTFYYRMTMPRFKLPYYLKNPKPIFKEKTKKLIAMEIDSLYTGNMVGAINSSQKKSPPFYTSLNKEWFDQERDRYGESVTLTIAFSAPVGSIKKMYKVFPEQISHVYLQIEGRDITLLRGKNE